MTPQNVTDLRDFLTLLEERDDLRRISVEVDPVEEIAAITDRVCKGAGGGRGLLFEKVRGHEFPVLTNLFGSMRRAAWAVGLEEPDELQQRIATELERFGGGTAADWLFWSLAEPQWQPRRVDDGPCREVVLTDPDLSLLPALKSWPGDGGRFLTQPLVFTIDPETGQTNCGMYRVRLLDKQKATLHWSAGSDGARHYAAWQKTGQAMPVAIALGGDPAAIFAAGTSLPEDVDELALAGFLRGRPLETISCRTCDLEVPANAEFLIEGVIYPGQSRPEGDFGNHSGCYDLSSPAPLLQITGMSHRRDPLYPAIVTGPPPMESGYLAKLGARLTLAMLKYDYSDVVDMEMPFETIFHGATLLSIRKDHKVPVQELVRRLWTKGPLERSRLLVVLDEGTDLRDYRSCFWKTVNRVSPGKDLIIDGDRLAVDATGSENDRPLVADKTVLDLISRRWQDYGIES